jgi:arginyl-tRNA synthetase
MIAMKQQLRNVIDATLLRLKELGQLQFDTAPHYTIDAPKNPEHGDWSCNVAMTLSKAAQKKPDEIADLLLSQLVDAQHIVKSAEKAKPAFLNFRLADTVFQQTAVDVLRAKDNYGRLVQPQPQRVLVEFVSANPTGPLHIGHARGALMGDAVARLLEAAGHQVTREFYVNDYGKQIETLGRTIFKRYRQLYGEQVELGPGEYPAEYVVDIAKAFRTQHGDRYRQVPETEAVEACTAFGMAYNLASIRKTLERAKIRHDNFESEAKLHAAGKVKGIVETYVARGVTYQAAEARRKDDETKVRDTESKAAQFALQQLGGTFLNTTFFRDDKTVKESRYKDEEDRIILRHDGTPVYLTADLAYHRSKFERGFDRIIDVLGADHSGHVPRIATGMKLLGLDADKLEFLLVQIVRLTRNGEEVKVSKRKGTVFELDDLIDEVGADVCRFAFLSKTANAQIDFDLESVKVQSKENPVFYFQYGHARCASLLRKAEAKGVPFVGVDNLTPEQLAYLTLPEEKQILKQLSLLPEVVAHAAAKLEPHSVLYFCSELIAEFHSYFTRYRNDPVVGDNADKTQGRLAMVAALKQTLKSAFAILGIDAPEQMSSDDMPLDDALSGAN